MEENTFELAATVKCDLPRAGMNTAAKVMAIQG